MRLFLVAISAFLLVGPTTADLKKSISAQTPWPGFPFKRPPAGFYPDPTPDPYYEEYDLGGDEIDDNTIGSVSKSDYKSTSAFQSSLASALHDFTFDLYTDMAKNWESDKNAVMSPLSIYTALCMLSLGLGGNSWTQAERVMHANAFGNIHEEMAELMYAVFKEREDATITAANRIYVDRSIQLLKNFKRSMRHDYKVSAKKVNFRSAPDLNRNRINGYVQKHTQRKIKDLAPAGSITSATRLFIVNAMYLKAAWKTSFYRTIPGTFTVSPSETIKTQMMVGTGGDCYSYASTDLDAQVVRMLLKGDLSVIFVIPSIAGDFSTLESDQGKALVRQMLELFYSREFASWPDTCRISMPKFNMDHSADDLIDCLKHLGMTDIFNAGTADLTRMTSSEEPLYVSDMRHKATIDFNEKGLEAAAATSIGISARMMPRAVDISKPFLFIVRDDRTGATLFTGKVVRPEYK